MHPLFHGHFNRAFALVLLVSAACGAPSPKPAAPSTDVVKFGRATESAVKVEPFASVSEIKKRWSLPRDTPRVMYADTQPVMKTSLVQILFRDLLKFAQSISSLSVRQNECLTGALSSTRELAAGETDEDGPLVLLRYDRATAANVDLDACVRELQVAAPTKIAGALSAFELNDMVLARDSDFYIIGKKPIVEAALTQRGTDATWPQGLALSGDQNLMVRAVLTEGKDGLDLTIKGSLAGSNDRFALEAEGQFKTEEEAEETEKKVTPLLANLNRVTSPEEQKLASLVQRHTRHTRSGKALSGVFELRESMEDQKRDFEVLSTLAFYGVGKYTSNAKTAEARNTIGQIAKAIITQSESESESENERDSLPGKTRVLKLVSFPAVPKTVPSGIKVQSKPSDWKAWMPIKFSFTDPQYFQYEVKAAKDGQSAEIIARGDLNGNGKTSLFVLRIKRDAKLNALMSAPNIAETDPEE
jgi:hypothetical protein